MSWRVARRARMRAVAAFVMALVGTLAVAGHAASGENPEVSLRRAAERTSFSNEEIADGFFKVAFGAELELGRQVHRIRKFEEPVRVFVVDGGNRARKAEIAAVVGDIRSRVNHLDLAMTNDRRAANFVVTLVRQRDLGRTIRARYGRNRENRIQQALDPECLAGIGKDETYRVRRAEVILPIDAGDFTFYDCAYEEVLQGLGPINDDASVPWTMFNDDIHMGFFDRYDQYILNILYDPAVRPGMTKEEVRKIFAEIMPRVRSWVASTNPLQQTEAQNGSDALKDGLQ